MALFLQAIFTHGFRTPVLQNPSALQDMARFHRFQLTAGMSSGTQTFSVARVALIFFTRQTQCELRLSAEPLCGRRQGVKPLARGVLLRPVPAGAWGGLDLPLCSVQKQPGPGRQTLVSAGWGTCAPAVFKVQPKEQQHNHCGQGCAPAEIPHPGTS